MCPAPDRVGRRGADHGPAIGPELRQNVGILRARDAWIGQFDGALTSGFDHEDSIFEFDDDAAARPRGTLDSALLTVDFATDRARDLEREQATHERTVALESQW